VTRVGARQVWALVAIAIAGHLLVNVITPFGVHRDELLYRAMGTHLRLWRMDFPPFIALVANLQRVLLGDALWAMRLLPAIAGGALLWCVAAGVRIVSPLRAVSVAALVCAMLLLLGAPVFLRPANLLQPVVFDQLWWTLALLALAQRLRTDGTHWWLAVGAALGLGLLTKFSIVFIGVGIVVGVLATPLRRDLRTPWPYLALLLALVIGAPSLVGQWRLDFPIGWQLRDLAAVQLERRSIVAFVAEQPLTVGPVAFAVAMTGLWWLWRAAHVSDGRPVSYRAIAVAVLVSWLLLTVQRGKGYYGAPVYPVLLAAGTCALAAWRRWLPPLAAAVHIAFAVIALPIALPILSPARTVQWAARLGVAEATRTNTGGQLALPQDFADMLGWREQAVAVAEAFRALTPADQDVVVIGASNYGRAGALDLYGPALGLPPVVSGAGSWWYWGPGVRRGDVLLVLTDHERDLADAFRQCVRLRTVGTPWGVEEERAVALVRCDGPKQPLQAMWAAFDPARP